MIERFLSDKQVEKRYAEAGRVFGDAVSYIYMGECVGFEGLLAKWAKWEKEYAKRGYRTIPIDDFIEYGGYGKSLTGLGMRWEQNEEPIFHAEIYREHYLGKISPAVNLQKLMKPESHDPNSTEPPEPKMQMGTYFLPSTKKAE